MELTRKIKNIFNKAGKIAAFSLIELMISLIAISVITAAFTPVISKKLRSADIIIGQTISEQVVCASGYELSNGACVACTGLYCSNGLAVSC